MKKKWNFCLENEKERKKEREREWEREWVSEWGRERERESEREILYVDFVNSAIILARFCQFSYYFS